MALLLSLSVCLKPVPELPVSARWQDLEDSSVRIEHALVVANTAQRKARTRDILDFLSYNL